MTHRDRAGDPSAKGAVRRGAAGDVGHRQGFPTHPAVRPRDRRRLAKAFGRRPAWLAVSPPPRHALLAENLGKPSLWVITKDHWYKPVATEGRASW
jgi:hypothetical protein